MEKVQVVASFAKAIFLYTRNIKDINRSKRTTRNYLERHLGFIVCTISGRHTYVHKLHTSTKFYIGRFEKGEDPRFQKPRVTLEKCRTKVDHVRINSLFIGMFVKCWLTNACPMHQTKARGMFIGSRKHQIIVHRNQSNILPNKSKCNLYSNKIEQLA